MEIRTHRTRDEIESDLANQGFKVIFEENDDQIWVNKEQNELLFVDWIGASVQVYELDKIVDLL